MKFFAVHGIWLRLALLSSLLIASCAPSHRSLSRLVSRGPGGENARAPAARVQPVARALEAELGWRRGDIDFACERFDAALAQERRDAGLWARAALAFLACDRAQDAEDAAARALYYNSSLCESWIAAEEVLRARGDEVGAAAARRGREQSCSWVRR